MCAFGKSDRASSFVVVQNVCDYSQARTWLLVFRSLSESLSVYLFLLSLSVCSLSSLSACRSPPPSLSFSLAFSKSLADVTAFVTTSEVKVFFENDHELMSTANTSRLITL